MRKNWLCILMVIVLFAMLGCSRPQKEQGAMTTTAAGTEEDRDIKREETSETTTEEYHCLVPEGMVLEERILPPEGYERTEAAEDSFLAFMRRMSLKEDGSPVLLYDGSEKWDQSAQTAVFDLDIGERDLQQCADSVMRVYAEYFWANEEYEKIRFHLTNGFLMEYTKWREGYRLNVDGNDVSWVKKTGYDDSYECFRSYMNMVFNYAGTLSLKAESEQIEISELREGDMFLYGGSPGHVVLVVDMAEDAQGNQAFLLAQGYMPAQDFHVLRNPQNEDDDPWYYVDRVSYPLHTPQYTFDEGSLVRWTVEEIE